MIYLDNAATTLKKPDSVGEAMVKALDSCGNSGRGAHKATLDASRIIYGTREKLARLFSTDDPMQIAFTCNATESLNIALKGLFEQGDHIISSVCEHNSVLRPLYELEECGISHSLVPADEKGRLRLEELEQLIRPETRAVVITHASNLTGNVTDLKTVSEFTKKHGLLLIVDASQSAGVIGIDVERMGIDILCFTGHKGLMGPQGTGGIYVRKGLRVRPLKCGGSGIRSYDRKHPDIMPTALEAGTLNGPGIAGLSAALDLLLECGVETIHEHESRLAAHFAEEAGKIPGVHLYGDLEAQERTAVVSLNVEGEDSGSVSDWLWENYEIATRAGAHCAPLMHEALGTVGSGAVRFSFGWFNTMEETDAAIAALKDFCG